MQRFKKVMGLLMSLVMIISLCNVSEGKVVKAESDEEVVLDVYEVSARNAFGDEFLTAKNGQTFATNDEDKAKSIADTDGSNISSIRKLTFVARTKYNGLTPTPLSSVLCDANTGTLPSGEDHAINFCFEALGSAGASSNVELTLCNYAGSLIDAKLIIPDKVRIHRLVDKKSDKPAGSDETTYTYTTNVVEVYLTSIEREAFGGNSINQNTYITLDLTIPQRVVEICDSAFKGNVKLRNISFKGAIQSIGKSAFSGCVRLEKLDLESLFSKVANNTIPDNCFYQCSSLTDVRIPDSILNIGKNAFYQCDKIDYIVLNNRIKTVADNAFAMCSDLRYLYIESKYQPDWSKIVDASEQDKLVIGDDRVKPIVVNSDTKTQFNTSMKADSEGKYYIYSSVDMDADNTKVTYARTGVDTNQVDVPLVKTLKTINNYRVMCLEFDIDKEGVYTIDASALKEITSENKTNKLQLSYYSSSADLVPPSISFDGVGSDDCYQNVKVTVTDESELVSVKLNGKPYVNGTLISEDGKYTIEAVDAYGNGVSKDFIVDTQAPKVITDGAETGIVKNFNLSRLYAGDVGLAGIKSVVINDISYELRADKKKIFDGIDCCSLNSNLNLENNVFNVTVTDKALNSTTLKIVCDSNGSKIDGITDGICLGKPLTVVFNTISGVVDATCTYTGADGIPVTYPINVGTVLDKSGSYSVSITDAVGSKSKVSFDIDLDAPVIKNITEGVYINALASDIEILDNHLKTVELDGVVIKGSSIKATDLMDNKVYKEGKHIITATDEGGNATRVSFIIDTTAPTTNARNTVKARTYLVSDALSGVSYAKLNNKAISGNTFKVRKDGKYTLVATDNAGNVLKKVFYKDTKKPEIKSIKNKAIYKTTKTIKFSDKLSGVKSAKLNGESIKSGTRVSEKGSYTLVVKDNCNNSVKVKFKVK